MDGGGVRRSVLSGRTRTILLTSAGIAGGGYLVYRVYNSAYVANKKEKVDKFLNGLSNISDAIATSGDVCSSIASDLNVFLLSESDEVPRSIRQLFKLCRAPEIRDAVAALAESATRGALLGATGTLDSRGNLCRSPSYSFSLPFEKSNHVGLNGATDTWQFSRGDDGEMAIDGLADKDVVRSRMKDKASSGNYQAPHARAQAGFVDKVLDKMFTDAGKGFASAVVGSVARNLLTSYFEQAAAISMREKERRPAAAGTNGFRNEGNADGGLAGVLLNMACSKDGKTLILDVVNSFIREAISVYIEQTRDVNMYDDIVASISKPENRAPVKDLMKTVCNEAVGTFVRTSHELLTSDSLPRRRYDVAGDGGVAETSSYADFGGDMGNYGSLALMQDGRLGLGEVDDDQTSSSWGARDDGVKGASVSSGESSDRSMGNRRGVGGVRNRAGFFDMSAVASSNNNNSSKGGGRGWIDRACEVLTVPNNRELVMDVAGTISFQSVRAFIIAFTDVLRTRRRKSGIKGKEEEEEEEVVGEGRKGGVGAMGALMEKQEMGRGMHIDRMRSTTSFLAERLDYSLRRNPTDFTITKAAKFVAAKALVCTSACLAICLHTIVGVKAMES